MIVMKSESAKLTRDMLYDESPVRIAFLVPAEQSPKDDRQDILLYTISNGNSIQRRLNQEQKSRWCRATDEDKEIARVTVARSHIEL